MPNWTMISSAQPGETNRSGTPGRYELHTSQTDTSSRRAFQALDRRFRAFQSKAIAARAAYRQAVATLARGRVDLQRTTIRSPVNGKITNLLVQLGDYATAGQAQISIVDSDSFWVDAYFEETALGAIHPGDRATIKLMGYRATLQGHVASIASGITVANAARGQSGLANVDPIFTWVRLAQRIPVRIQIDHVPEGVVLVAGQTASVQIQPSSDRR